MFYNISSQNDFNAKNAFVLGKQKNLKLKGIFWLQLKDTKNKS